MGKQKADVALRDAHKRWREKGGDEKMYWDWMEKIKKSKNLGYFIEDYKIEKI